MCRWLGYFGSPLRLEELVYNTTHSLIEQSRAARENPGLAPGVNVADGKVTYRPVAEATGQAYSELFDVLGEGAPA